MHLGTTDTSFLQILLNGGYVLWTIISLTDVGDCTSHDTVEDPIAIDMKEDEEHLRVTAIESSRLVK